MPWTASIKQMTRQDERVEALVQLSDGTTTLQYRYAVSAREASSAWLRRQVLATIAATEMVSRDMVIGTTIDTTPDPPPPSPPPPTQAELDLRAFAENYRRLIGVRRAIDSGVLVGNEAFVTTLLQDVRAAFLPSYVDLL